MTQKPIINKYIDKDILELPSIVELNDEEKSYLMGLVSSVHRVIDASSSLEIEESEILGEGNFFWPKDPQAPVMRSKFLSRKKFSDAWNPDKHQQGRQRESMEQGLDFSNSSKLSYWCFLDESSCAIL